jgi:hypothetical protein
VHQVPTKNLNFASLFPLVFLGVVKEGGGSNGLFSISEWSQGWRVGVFARRFSQIWLSTRCESKKIKIKSSTSFGLNARNQLQKFGDFSK